MGPILDMKETAVDLKKDTETREKMRFSHETYGQIHIFHTESKVLENDWTIQVSGFSFSQNSFMIL